MPRLIKVLQDEPRCLQTNHISSTSLKFQEIQMLFLCRALPYYCGHCIFRLQIYWLMSCGSFATSYLFHHSQRKILIFPSCIRQLYRSIRITSWLALLMAILSTQLSDCLSTTASTYETIDSGNRSSSQRRIRWDVKLGELTETILVLSTCFLTKGNRHAASTKY